MPTRPAATACTCASIIVETAANQAGAVAAMEDAGAALSAGPLSAPNFKERLLTAIWQAGSVLEDISVRAARQ